MGDDAKKKVSPIIQCSMNKHNSLPIGPIQPSTKELHGNGQVQRILTTWGSVTVRLVSMPSVLGSIKYTTTSF